MATDSVSLYGRVFITGHIKAITGLHIGGGAGALEIGGVDSPIIRDPLTSKPYIPGSSLRGKIRSLSEKRYGLKQVPIGSDVRIHICKTKTHMVEGKKVQMPDEDQPYKKCPVCPVFGVPGNEFADAPTRLVVRDVVLSDNSATKLQAAQTDLPFSEVKWEATIDRVTSAAVPRQIERVPAGAEFENFEMVYSIYHEADISRLITVVEAMQLLEDDYLGGLGSRGGGKIAFQNLDIYARSSKDYGEKVDCPLTKDQKEITVEEVLKHKGDLLDWVRDTIATS